MDVVVLALNIAMQEQQFSEEQCQGRAQLSQVMAINGMLKCLNGADTFSAGQLCKWEESTCMQPAVLVEPGEGADMGRLYFHFVTTHSTSTPRVLVLLPLLEGDGVRGTLSVSSAAYKRLQGVVAALLASRNAAGLCGKPRLGHERVWRNFFV